jgi:hypothetical protein
MGAHKSWFLVTIVVSMLLISPAVAYGGCDTPGNLVNNPNFDTFTGAPPRQVAAGWTPWATMGDPAFDQDNHGSAPGAPAQRIWSDGGTWTAGLYQQVAVAAGRGYRAWVEWSPSQCPQKEYCEDIERRIGIDPFGGTDPLSPKVVWGPSVWASEKMADVHVAAFAQSATITVFLWTHHPVSHGQDQVYFDCVILVEDPSVGPPTKPATPTPTRRPATNTPRPATATATDTPTPEPPTATITPTLTSTPTSTDTTTPTATATPTPTWMPTPLAVPAARAAQTPVVGSTSRSKPVQGRGLGPESLLLYIGGGAAALAILVGVAAAGLWLSGWLTLGKKKS